MEKGIIFNIQKFCIHDGDGIRTCVFLKGCPLRCIWCHNPEGLKKEITLSFNRAKCSSCGKCTVDCSARSIKNNKLILDHEGCSSCGKCIQACLYDANELIGKEVNSAEVFDEVIKDEIFYKSSGGGLTVTGGEPSYQPDFTLELLRLSKEAGISAAIETCGIGSREFYESAADLDATFLFDIKCMDPSRHKELTGADNSSILSNLRYLMGRNADIIIRMPLIPNCNDSDEDIAKLSDFLNKNKGRFRYAEIMPYHTFGAGKAESIGFVGGLKGEAASESQISRWLSLFSSYGIEAEISK